MARPKGYPKSGGRQRGTPNKDKPYRAALQKVIDENPDLLEKIALAQLEAAAGIGEDGFANVGAARELADRLDGKVTQTHDANINGSMNVTVVFADGDA